MLLHIIRSFLELLIEPGKLIAIIVDEQFQFFLFLAEASDLMVVLFLQLQVFLVPFIDLFCYLLVVV